ncbi:MAG: sugar-binding domain-containing protein, partial [Candidatus Poribacteria bacterium]
MRIKLINARPILAFLMIYCFLSIVSAKAIETEIPDIDQISLNGTWKFKADPDNIGVNEKWNAKDFDDSSWENISVPGTWNEGQNVTIPVWNYDGVGWYRRIIEPPKDWAGENIRLKFMAVYLIADVWL